MNNPTTPQQQEHPPAYAYPAIDEISLVDIWLLLVRRKKLIIGTFLICLGIAGLSIWLAKPIYESRAVIEIGQVGSKGLLVDPAVLVEQLKEEYKVVDRHIRGEKEINPPYIDTVTINASAKNFVTVTAYGYSAPQAQQFLNEVVNKVIKKQQALYDQAITKKRYLLNALDIEIDQIRKVVESLYSQPSSLYRKDPSIGLLMNIEKTRALEQIPVLAQQRSQLALEISDLHSWPTKLVRNPTLPVGPIKPRPKLYLALGVVIGIMLGIFMAFFAHFVSNIRRELSGE